MLFKELGLSDKVLQGIRAMGWVDPTPIQLRAIPMFLEGRDVIGSAQTGTGKTGAFALPILTRLERHQPGTPRALVLEPTRELAAQVETAFRDCARFTDLKIAVLYGGVGYGRQIQDLQRGVDILVATPGRLLDHMQHGRCKLNAIQYLVLDEADRMLDMGFLPDVRRIIERCPRKRHTSLFSATIPPQIETLIQWAMRNPVTIEIGARRPAETIRHVIYPVADSQKLDLLLELLERVNYDSVIVFCRTRNRADQVARLLKTHKHAVAVLHSNRTQAEREQALRGFRDGRYEVLVATDIAARGLDIQDVSHVINFDVPQHPEDYVHRIGRTGRAQATGDALTIMVAEDAGHVAAIERFIGQSIPREKLEDFKYTYTALFEHSPSGKGAGSVPKTRGVRLSGGYYFGRVGGKGKGRRRRR